MNFKHKFFVAFIFFTISPKQPAMAASIDFVSVGAGDCIVIHCPVGRPILMDCGSSTRQAHSPDVTQWLTERAPNGFSKITVTHGDADHYNFIRELITRFSQQNPPVSATPSFMFGGLVEDFTGAAGGESLFDVVASIDNVNIETLNHINFDELGPLHNELTFWEALQIAPNDHARMTCEGPGNMRFRILSVNYFSTVTPYNHTSIPKNERSMTVLLQYTNQVGQSVEVFLTGDSGRASDQQIMNRYGDALNRNTHNVYHRLLKVAHHGSRNESAINWLNYVRPESALISAGGAYNHPACETLGNLNNVLLTGANNPTHELQCFQLNGNNNPLPSREVSRSIRSTFPFPDWCNGVHYYNFNLDTLTWHEHCDTPTLKAKKLKSSIWQRIQKALGIRKPYKTKKQRKPILKKPKTRKPAAPTPPKKPINVWG